MTFYNWEMLILTPLGRGEIDDKLYVLPDLYTFLDIVENTKVLYHKYYLSICSLNGDILDSKESGEIKRIQPFPRYIKGRPYYMYVADGGRKFTVVIDAE